MGKKFFPALQYVNLANSMTSFSLVLGFGSIVLLTRDAVTWSFICYALAILIDRLDGLVARRLGQSTPMGKELDSLADAINFCLYPPLFFWLAAEPPIWTIPFLLAYLLSGVWRLGYFNIAGLQETNGQACFIGVPTTVCAGWFIVVNALLEMVHMSTIMDAAVMCCYFIVSASLMISSMSFAKNGVGIKLLYVLIPAALVILW